MKQWIRVGSQWVTRGKSSRLKVQRWRLWNKKRRCHYCNEVLPNFEDTTLDHRVPISRGGTSHIWNLVLCCGECNKNKGNLTEWEYRNQLRINREKEKFT
jgi:5-methylcytosine-specific restriction protein A